MQVFSFDLSIKKRKKARVFFRIAILYKYVIIKIRIADTILTQTLWALTFG
jgi:hypothetical protein